MLKEKGVPGARKKHAACLHQEWHQMHTISNETLPELAGAKRRQDHEDSQDAAFEEAGT